ncbi:conjugal transfer protein TrbI [Brasilonema bromeliae]|uniref:Conjugal transfer protein TrbI n=1 Tax=Brasilonema bromeliae SPC951 TaxID=385972 RepID=A0ABX1P6Y6_9CYAN|nr:conjugal transfer protein TrbI [Brasilonema bromeliae]NMG20155.1 conjugal transfer protein TrbI [Brasilonema bromeliae SPC951]
MSQFHRWKSGAAGVMAMAITTGTIAPMFMFAPASAQSIFRGQGSQAPTGRVSIPAGFTLPITYDKDKIVVTPDETTRIKLKVAKNLVDSSRNVLVPEGSEIEGQLQPITRNGEKGIYFVAQDLILPNGERQSINATSRVITRKEKISKGGRTDKIIQDAAIGAGAASVISLITGDRKIQALEPILGAGAGAAASVLLRRKNTEVIVIEPQRGDLDLTLRSSLFVSRGYY